jgi:6-phosphogluconolactonase
MDLSTGAMELEGATASENPSFLALSPDDRFLYAVNEADPAEVTAFSIDAKTGDLTLLNKVPAGGSAPCHVVVDGSGKHVLIATYGGGNVSSFPIGEDGSLGTATAFVQHKRTPADESGPNAHSINLSADNRFAFVVDLGLNKVFIYHFDAAKGTLVPHEQPSVSLKPGAGPRHFAFHPDGQYAYVINEKDSTMTAFAYNAEHGTLREIQTQTTLPAGVEQSWTAEVQVEPSGRFVYGSNRGHASIPVDSIAVFAVAPDKGTLTLVEHEPTQGKFPRGFGIDPTGQFLVVGNEQSDTIVVLRINQKTGGLEPTGHVLSVPKPVCVKFLEL